MGDPSVGMRKVTRKLWWRTSRLASSTSGMRWPIPGLGTMATWCGSGSVCCMIDGCSSLKMRENNGFLDGYV